MNWTLKPFDQLTLNELYGLLRLRCEVFIVEQVAYQDIDDLDQQAWHLFAQDARGAVIACLRIFPKGVVYPDAAAIGRLCVSAAHRRRGLASQMLDRALEYIDHTLALPATRISAQRYLQAFYESRGFVQSGEGYLEDGIPHIPMLRRGGC